MNNYNVHIVLIAKVLIGSKGIDFLFQHYSKIHCLLNEHQKVIMTTIIVTASV